MEQYDLHCPAFEPVGDHGIYDYFLMNTAHLGDYPAFQHRLRDHMRSELIGDIEALACYFAHDLGYRAGDAEDYRRQITEACALRLPKFSVPRDIRFLKALPRTRVLKVDFMKLRQNTPEDPIYTE